MRALGLAALLGLAAACGKSESECRAEARELQALLRAADTGPTVVYVDRDITLVPRPELARSVALYGAVVTITADGGLRFGSRRGIGLDELRLELTEMRQQHPRTEPEPLAYLVIDAAAPWGRVVEAATAVRDAGIAQVGFAFGIVTAGPPPPPRNWMDDKLDALFGGEPGERAVELAKLVEQVVKPCPALTRLFGQVGGAAGESKAKFIIDGLEAALVECKCDFDVAALRSALYRVMHDDLAARAEPVTLSAEGRPFTAPATATWREVAGRVRDLQLPVRFDVGP
jgi:hypothetical protein